jgi:hypothetical protein
MAEVRIEGLRECLGNLDLYANGLKKATPKSLKEGGLFLQRESQEEVPRLTGVLANSAYTKNVGEEEVHVGYKNPYGIYVHENTNLNHTNGKAKFLTDPMEDKADEIVKVIANEMKKVKPRTV